MVATLPLSPINHHLCRSNNFGNNASLLTLQFFPRILSLSPSLLDNTGIGFTSRLRARGPMIFSASATNSILHDVGATGAVLGGAYALVFGFESLTKRNLIPQLFIAILTTVYPSLSKIRWIPVLISNRGYSEYRENLSRKLVHILSGLLFVLSWPIFSESSEARYFAAFVPLVNSARLVINGLSLSPDSTLIKSVTREGRPEELLKGPLFYVLALLISAVFFWRDSPIGMLSLAMMCGGDGIADIMGRKFGSHKIPYNARKSWAGSISMFIFGFFISVGLLYYYSSLGYLHLNWEDTIERVAVVSMVATVVESLPITDLIDDNVSVPLVTIVAAYLSFGY